MLRKLVAKTICLQEADRFQPHFCSEAVAGEVAAVTQVGVAVPGGVDRVVHQTRVLLESHPDWVVVKVDAKNAFNTLSRRAIVASVRQHFPGLAPFTDLCYEEPTPLFFRCERGHARLESREGTHQGDPLGCFYLSLPLHDVLRALHSEHPEVVISAYIDDVFLIGPREEVAAAYRDLVGRMERSLGLTSQARKCAVYSPAGGIPPGLFPAGMPGADGGAAVGIEILGIPVGTDAYVCDFAERRVRQLDQVIPALSHLRDPQVQYLLLRCCANARVSHLLRGIDPPHPGGARGCRARSRCVGGAPGNPARRPPVGEVADGGSSPHPPGWAGPALGGAHRPRGLPWLLGLGYGPPGGVLPHPPGCGAGC